MRSLLLLTLVFALVACGDGGDTTGTTVTGAPTTGAETTLPETTAAETTVVETTSPETTAAQTTMAPTTVAPTTAAPTTSTPPTTVAETTTPAETTAPPAETSEIISPSGFWEVRIGETIGENEDRIGLPLQDVGGDPNHCMILQLPEVGGIYFLGSTLDGNPVDGRSNLTVARVSADSPGWVTENGIEVGMSVEEAESTLGDSITDREPHAYVENGEYLIVGPEDSRYIFETDGDSITAIHAGLEPVVSYIEACS